MPCKHPATAKPQAEPRLTPARSFRDEDMDAALAHLREVRDKYWDHDWRRAHRGYGRYPENELWDAVEGFLDLMPPGPARRTPEIP